MTEQKVELGSDAWIELARSYLDEHVPTTAEQFGNVRFSLCEVFRSPPAHLDDGTGKAAWWFAISGPDVEVGRGDRTDLDHRWEGDYDEILPRARLIYDLADPSIRAFLRDQAEERRKAAEAAGEEPKEIPTELGGLLLDLHNFLCVRTA